MAPNRRSGTGETSAEEGFTLIEVLVAVAILGVSLAFLLSGFSASLARMEETRDETTALALAQSLMDRAGHDIALEKEVVEGASEKGAFAWRVESKRYGSDADQMAWAAAAYEVSVKVSWDEDAVELRTLKIAQKPK